MKSFNSLQLPSPSRLAFHAEWSHSNVKGRKCHLLVDTMGLLLAVVVTAASTSDPAGARLLFRRLGGATKQLRTVWVDGT